MSFDKILFAFVIVLALTLNVGFVVGDIDDITHHDKYELALAIVVSLVATVMKFGDRSLLGSTMLATSLVADVQLIAAAVVWASEWANPRPDVPIASVTLVGSPGPSKARPILFGVTAVEKPRVEDLR